MNPEQIAGAEYSAPTQAETRKLTAETLAALTPPHCNQSEQDCNSSHEPKCNHFHFMLLLVVCAPMLGGITAYLWACGIVIIFIISQLGYETIAEKLVRKNACQ